MANVGDDCPGCNVGSVELQPAGISKASKKRYPAFHKCSLKCGWTENIAAPIAATPAPTAPVAVADTGANRRCALEQAVRLYGDKPATLALVLGTAEEMLAWLEGKTTTQGG